MNEGRVSANGIDFAYLEEGTGPLVLLLHGFPDNAHTWDEVLPGIAQAGYRVVAPWTRGYPPTQIPGDGAFFDAATLATDARVLIEMLNDGPAHVVGHDWGGATAWYLISAYPEVVRRAAILGIPHPFMVAKAFTDPAAIHAVFHFWFFQIPGLSEAAVRANDFAMIDYLWNLWSPGLEDAEHIADVKRTFAEPGAVEAALAYYRTLLDPTKQDPALAFVRDALAKPITVPTLSMIGARELVRAAAGEAQRTLFAPDVEYKFEGVKNASHFLHREHPKEVTETIVEWLARSPLG